MIDLAKITEQVFFNRPLLMLADARHSDLERRFHALGKTGEGPVAHFFHAAPAR